MAATHRSLRPQWPFSIVHPFDTVSSKILGNRGAVYEGDIFFMAKQDGRVIRAFEFARADGALDCSEQYNFHDRFADRYWDMDQASRKAPGLKKMMLWDAKSSIGRRAGTQAYTTTEAQRSRVSFYLGICAADPGYVDLIPNYHQEQPCASLTTSATSEDLPTAATDMSNRQTTMSPSATRVRGSRRAIATDSSTSTRHRAINNSRGHKLPPAVYTLDPCGSPTRMPAGYLLEALGRARRCALEGHVYVNPWTNVPFPDWKPVITNSPELLRPAESTEHFTAYLATMRVYRAVKMYGIELDFVGLQPRLADFKLLLPDASAPSGCLQYLIQHKLDARDRRRSTPLTNVAIARATEDGPRYYCADTDRYDFLFYQFSFSNRPDPRPIVELFLLPEWELPDEFYTCDANEQSFERANFQKYRVVMDREEKWVLQAIQIIRDNPQPRQASPRPSRPEYSKAETASEITLPEPLRTRGRIRTVKPTPKKAKAAHAKFKAPTPSKLRKWSGPRAQYKASVTHAHIRFYRNIMHECARRGLGLLLPLSTGHPMGDFVFCRFVWTPQQQQIFIKSNEVAPPPPLRLDALPAFTPTIPMYYFVRAQECTSTGPALAASQFRRLNSCRNNRLTIFDLFGPDEPGDSVPLALIPSIDLCPTASQRSEIFEHNLGLGLEKAKRFKPTALVSHVLNTSYYTGEYVVGGGGPLSYQGQSWSQIWEFLNCLTGSQQFEHPEGRTHHPASLSTPLWKVHERLAQEDAERDLESIRATQERGFQ